MSGTKAETAMSAQRLARLDEPALLRRLDDLMNQVWHCRRRGWTRKLEAARAELRTALYELDRRIEAEKSAG